MAILTKSVPVEAYWSIRMVERAYLTCNLCSIGELSKRLNCKCSSRGSIYIYKEGIDNKIRKE